MEGEVNKGNRSDNSKWNGFNIKQKLLRQDYRETNKQYYEIEW